MSEAIQSRKVVKREQSVHVHTALFTSYTYQATVWHTALAAMAVSELSAQLPLALICIQMICIQDMLTVSYELQSISWSETGQKGNVQALLGQVVAFMVLWSSAWLMVYMYAWHRLVCMPEVPDCWSVIHSYDRYRLLLCARLVIGRCLWWHLPHRLSRSETDVTVACGLSTPCPYSGVQVS